MTRRFWRCQAFSRSPSYTYTLPISIDIPGPKDLTILDRYLLLAGPGRGLRQPVHFWTGFPGDRFRSWLVWQASIV